MTKLTDDQRGLFLSLIEGVKRDLGQVIQSSGDRMPSGGRLLGRFEAASDRLLQEGLGHLGHLEEVHNELIVAVALLENTVTPCRHVEYEPPLPSCDKRFDFRAERGDDPMRWFEVKTIHPRRQNDWTRYEAAVSAGRFPDNARLIFEKEWLGGELYHKAYAARTKILDCTLEMEAKISECLRDTSDQTFLVLFSNGLDWHRSELEDFVYFYRKGQHFEGDHFGAMEKHYIQSSGIKLARNIDCFGFFKRSTTSIRPVGGVWCLEPTEWPPG